MRNLKVMAALNRFGLGGVEFLLFTEDAMGRRCVAEACSFREVDESHVPTPSFTLDRTAAQALMDQLWDCGLRPTEGTGSAGAMAAVQAHLKDMRALAGKALGVSL